MNVSFRNVNMKKKQGGFMGFGILEYTVIVVGVLGLATLFFLPAIKSMNEQSEATEIIAGLNTINEAAFKSKYGRVSDFTGIKFADLTNLLPEGFSQRAANGQNYGIDVATDTTKFNTTISIPNVRILERVKSSFKPHQFTVSGTTFSMEGP
ncbi:hypothetical protein BCT01_08455 [Vibrio tasmaniensis]|uniref:Uncharacterized protein n=2 Tax=Vibrio tasmaniensis TaxID=212663 RepID=A0A2N7NNF7_9VIBR|nr:hypothetical protein [Vibrio tasmaniensis]PMO80312.1 hypothetical protein BCT01_08455 [Vibrio tasmaniensis]PMP17820.1 hypothetical protein BCS92_05275 [Vibrio tasmaniensis]TKG50634.1 hypothetical protein FC060_05950 [Vibrio tasmaniensis]TKG60387.1 hypothetical protein FC072_17935 [Vibrio tasmaniensis]